MVNKFGYSFGFLNSVVTKPPHLLYYWWINHITEKSYLTFLYTVWLYDFIIPFISCRTLNEANNYQVQEVL